MKTLERTDEIQMYDRFLSQHGYHIGKSDENVYRIERKQPLSRFIVLTIFVLGIVICILSIVLADYRLLFLGFLMALFPLINRGWKYPLAIVFDRVENFLTLERGVLFKSYQLYPMEHIDEIAVHRVSKATEVNPFEDGNKEHVYVFSVMQKDKSHQLMRFVSRKNIDKSAKTFSSYLNRLTK